MKLIFLILKLSKDSMISNIIVKSFTFLFIFQLGDFSNQTNSNSTILPTIQTFPQNRSSAKLKSKQEIIFKTSIADVYLNSLKNSSDNMSAFLSSEGFSSLILKLGLRKRNNISKTFNNVSIKCHSPIQMLSWFNKTKSGLSKEDFITLCPSLLVQMVSRVCRPNVTQPMKPMKPMNNTSSPVINNNLAIWLCSFGAVIVISLVGLLVVWLIPIMPKSYYNSISQLLIALAVGSLAGDALLHLIPHALMDDGEKGHSHNGHNKMVWKSLVALIGIHLFFLTERITILYQNLRSKRKSKKQHFLKLLTKKLSLENFYSEASAGDKFEDSEKAPVKSSENKALSTGKLHWASKSRKYSGSSKELVHASSHIGIDGEVNIGAHLCNRPKSKPHVNSDCPDSMNYELCNTINPYSMNPESNGCNPNNSEARLQTNGEIKTVQPIEESKPNYLLTDRQLTNISSAQNETSNWSNKEDHKLLSPQIPPENNPNNVEIKTVGTKHSDHTERLEIGAGGATVKSSLAHPFKNKPHGHHHGHSHDLSSVKAIAYTVIAGDGLHNFCDGIAIGAAFANDIGGGLSTAIAVLCHELPHELGDFVVLLHAGMSLRTAIFYNLMSSVFCAIGMVIGVQLGKLPSISSWIFMLTAGMFLYIALVDMMPELSTRRLKGNKIFHRPSILFLWQNIGFVIGSAIMLVIALYEEHMF
uniref:Slc39a-4 n=1 Tax=Schmidtea mediterranea TaxID=79327 RepID=A0A0H3YJK3_SCHMD|nr:slc39a-4 [Schmidtea mediterranea]